MLTEESIPISRIKKLGKRFLQAVGSFLFAVVIFFLIKYAIIGILSSIDGNDKCVLYMRYHFSNYLTSDCTIRLFSINIIAIVIGVVVFIISMFRKIQNVAQNKHNILQYIWAVVYAILVFFLVRYAISGTTFDPLAGYLCPQDWGPGSANWECEKELAKLSPHAWFVTVSVTAFICSVIAFLTVFPKTTKYHKIVFWFLICLIFTVVGYYVITDFELIFNALITNVDFINSFWFWTLRL